jgi:hypothetical protein
VPDLGIAVIESTAEGQEGDFYTIATRAEANNKTKPPELLRPAEYRFHFYPWFQQAEYRLPREVARRVRISSKEHEYFDTIELVMGAEIDLGQRAWYIDKRDNDFASAPDDMWREFPSTPEECWKASTEGKYLAKSLLIARREGRIGTVPYVSNVPVNTFWDIGAGDDTAIWFHQRVGLVDRFIKFYEAAGEGYLHFVLMMERLGWLFGTHYLPHDAEQKRQGVTALTSPILMLREMRPLWNFVVVPRVQTIQHGVTMLREDFSNYWFDEAGCKEGLLHLESYSREWNSRLQCWHDYPRHDEHSHAADALRQKAQGYTAPSHTAQGSTAAAEQARRAKLRRRPNGLTA